MYNVVGYILGLILLIVGMIMIVDTGSGSTEYIIGWICSCVGLTINLICTFLIPD